MKAPETLRTFDGAEFELRATTRTGIALYAIKGAPKCCPPQLMATLATLAEHGIQSAELAAAVAELGALPVPAGNADTLPAWLRQRFTSSAVTWANLDDVERSYWEHEARAVRRAVQRGGFRQTGGAS
jgi:hypothetical protein